MKELRQYYLELATELEKTFSRLDAKREAAILLRNHAIETPHCHFCGEPDKRELYDSRYNPKARICRGCVREISKEFDRLRNVLRNPPQNESVSAG